MMATQAVRTEWLNHARHLFYTEGYQTTTTRALNEALGAAVGTLYYYFPGGKHELLSELMTAAQGFALPSVWRLESNTKAALADSVLAGFVKLFEWFVDPAHFETTVILIRERAQLSQKQTAWLVEQHQRGVANLAKALQGAVKSAQPGECEAAAQLLSAAYQNMILSTVLVQGQPAQDINVVQRLRPSVNLVVAALLNSACTH